MKAPSVYSLHYGRRIKPLATVRPDEKYPEMYRVHWPDGTISDMVNLTRAKDAAYSLARQRHPEFAQQKNSRFQWKISAGTG